MAINLLFVAGCPVLALPRMPAMVKGGIALVRSEKTASGSRSRRGTHEIARKQARPDSTHRDLSNLVLSLEF